MPLSDLRSLSTIWSGVCGSNLCDYQQPQYKSTSIPTAWLPRNGQICTAHYFQDAPSVIYTIAETKSGARTSTCTVSDIMFAVISLRFHWKMYSILQGCIDSQLNYIVCVICKWRKMHDLDVVTADQTWDRKPKCVVIKSSYITIMPMLLGLFGYLFNSFWLTRLSDDNV